MATTECVRGAGGKGGGSGGHEADDTLFSTAYVEVVYALGEGEIKGLANGSQSIFLNETPITASDGLQNYKVSWDIGLGTQSQAPFPAIKSVSSETQVGVKVEKATPHVETITDTQVDYAVVTIGFPTLMYMDTKGNSSGTTVEFKIECQDTGTVGAPYVQVARSALRTGGAFNLGASYYQSPANTYGAEVILYSSTGGTMDILHSTDGITFSTFETVELLVNETISNRLFGYQYTATVSLTFTSETVQYLRLPAFGKVTWYSYSDTGNIIIKDKCRSRAQRQYRFPLLGVGGWNIRVTRITNDSTSVRLMDEIWVDSLRIEKAVQLSYPNTALLYLKISAKEFSSPPRVRVELLNKLIRVPVNYDPLTRQTSGIWNGTFKVAYCTNPAWVFYDLATDSRYGLGRYIGSAGIDKWALYKIAQYCDGMVDSGYRAENGDIILEPRFSFNGPLDLSQNEAFNVLKNLCSVFRGMMFVINGQLTATCDQPSDPVMLFTPANVIGGKFKFAGSGGLARKSVALVQWSDPSDMYQPKVEYVPSQVKLARYGYQETQVVAYGCTSRGQAHRLGKWLLLDGETVTFTVGDDAALVKPNDLVQCMIPLRNQGKRLGGRIMAVNGLQITLDAPVTLITGHDYVLYVALADGTTASKSIVVSAGIVDTLTLTSALGETVDKAVWVLCDLHGIQPTTWRVLDISENGDITALSYHNAYTDIDNFSTPIDGSLLHSLNPFVVDAVSNITVELVPYTDKNDLIKNVLAIHWTQVISAQTYSLRWRVGNGVWQIEPAVLSNHFDLPITADGDYEFEIVAFNALGKPSAPSLTSRMITGIADSARSAVHVVASEAEMLALTTVKKGDLIKRTDLGKTLVYKGGA